MLNRFNFKSGKEYEADAVVQNLEISKILQMIGGEKPIDAEGLANGNLHIKMDKNTIKPLIDIDFSNLKMNGKEMGNAEVII